MDLCTGLRYVTVSKPGSRIVSVPPILTVHAHATSSFILAGSVPHIVSEGHAPGNTPVPCNPIAHMTVLSRPLGASRVSFRRVHSNYYEILEPPFPLLTPPLLRCLWAGPGTLPKPWCNWIYHSPFICGKSWGADIDMRSYGPSVIASQFSSLIY